MCHASGARHRVGRGHLDSGRAAQSIAHMAVAFRWGGFTSIRPVGLLGSGCARDVLAGLAHIRGCCRVGVWSSGQGETDRIDQGCVEAILHFQRDTRAGALRSVRKRALAVRASEGRLAVVGGLRPILCRSIGLRLRRWIGRRRGTRRAERVLHLLVDARVAILVHRPVQSLVAELHA